MTTAIHLFFAGIWAEVWHWGLGVALIILLVAGSIFSQSIPLIGPWLAPLRKDMLWAAAVIAVLLIGEYIGARDAKVQYAAQQTVIINQVGKVVDSVVNDPRNKPQPQRKVKKGQKPVPRTVPTDRWDNPEN